MFIDFAELKARVSFGQTINALKLNLKQSGNQWRGACPSCTGAMSPHGKDAAASGDRALVVTEGKGFFCFLAKQGGDQIALVAHILGMSVKDAAQELERRTGAIDTSTRTSRTVPQSEKGEETQKLQPLSYLEGEHPAVDAIGFSAEVVKRLGIGYAPKGIMRGTVAVPIRDEGGTLVGYIGITEAKLPPSFTSNVVELKRPA